LYYLKFKVSFSCPSGQAQAENNMTQKKEKNGGFHCRLHKRGALKNWALKAGRFENCIALGGFLQDFRFRIKCTRKGYILIGTSPIVG
jgi:hypothetical protein